MDQAWFEMRDIRKKSVDGAVWIPLRASIVESCGGRGQLGFREEFIGSTSLAISVERRDEAQSLDWMTIGLRHSHHACVVNGQYVPADVFTYHRTNLTGVCLALEQDGNGAELTEWHLHLDLVIALGLKREGDTWLAATEGYVEVVRLHRERGKPSLLEIRAEHLKDYLCARGMGLFVSSYRRREEVSEVAGHIQWPEDMIHEETIGDRWEGRRTEIHEGGTPFGSSFAVIRVGRTNITGEDVPTISASDESITYESDTGSHKGRKLVRVQGELWRKEWVNPAAKSPRVRDDELPSSVSYLMDNAGVRENREALIRGGKWLWFRPGVIMELAHRRGGGLRWQSRDVGRVWCAPGHGVDFGVNAIGLITVYAKDIAMLPDWQQRLWAGFNISPEGGVGDELFGMQAKGIPSDTLAPEPFLRGGIELLNTLSQEKLKFRLFREHEQFEMLIARTHGFRSIEKTGFFSLAKDIARLTADGIDASALQKLVAPPRGEKWGSLKNLEKVLALKVDHEEARKLLGPLVGAYELRHADAHLPGNELANAFGLVRVDDTAPFVLQGYQLLSACVTALHGIARVLKRWDGGVTTAT